MVFLKTVPWWLKISIKIILSRLPIPYGWWQSIRLFRHGAMDNGEYAFETFVSHLQKCGKTSEWMEGRTVLEIGPGDGVSTALVAHAMGGQAILVDVGPYANAELVAYVPLYKVLQRKGFACINPLDFNSLGELIEACGARYLTGGVSVWGEIEEDSVDMIFSQAVMEHVALADFDEVAKQCTRVARSGALVSHRVDLQDHLGGALNNLRFSDRLWESQLFTRSGFYTNRIQMQEMLRRFEKCGMQIQSLTERRWPSLPTAKNKMAKRFREMPTPVLNVSGFDVLLEKT